MHIHVWADLFCNRPAQLPVHPTPGCISVLRVSRYGSAIFIPFILFKKTKNSFCKKQNRPKHFNAGMYCSVAFPYVKGRYNIMLNLCVYVWFGVVVVVVVDDDVVVVVVVFHVFVFFL